MLIRGVHEQLSALFSDSDDALQGMLPLGFLREPFDSSKDILVMCRQKATAQPEYAPRIILLSS